jgi:hypothetical protein
MKKVILTIAMFTAFGVNAQLKVEENTMKDSLVWRPIGLSTMPALRVYTMDEQSEYTFFYQNAKYTAIVDIDYINIGDKEETKQFFDVLLDVIETGKEYTIELEGKRWSISKSAMYVFIWSSDTHFYLTKKQVQSIKEKLQ